MSDPNLDPDILKGLTVGLGTVIMSMFAFLTHRIHARVDKHEDRIDKIDAEKVPRVELNGAVTRIYDKIDEHQAESKHNIEQLKLDVNSKIDTIITLLKDKS